MKSDHRSLRKIGAFSAGTSQEAYPSFHPVPKLASELHEEFSKAVQEGNMSSHSGLITSAALEFWPKSYDPDFPLWSVGTRRYDPFTLAPNTSLKLEFSDKSLRTLETSALNQFNVSSYAHMLAQAQQTVLEAGFDSEQQMEDFYQANLALQEATNHMLVLSAQSLTNFNLMRRDMLLATQSEVSNDATFLRKARRSTLEPDSVFGNETQAALDEHNSSPATITTNILSSDKRLGSKFSAKAAYKSAKKHSFRGQRRNGKSNYRRRKGGRGWRGAKTSATTTSGTSK